MCDHLLLQEVLERFKVAWASEAEPWKGFRYIYLTEEDYKCVRH